jgi:hypothetical protein
MTIEPYSLLVTLHVVLFAYWLGGDWGVFVCSRYVAKPELSLAERERFLEALMAIDILPRTAIVLLPFVGLQLAALRGSVQISQAGLALAWVVGLIWLGVIWAAYRNMRKPSGIFWQRIDVGWRIILILVLIATGITSLLNAWPFNAKWIATKLLVYAALLCVGLYLRISIRGWREGFSRLRDGQSGPDIDALFIDGRRRAKYAAWLFWSLIVVMAWLGIRQPF